MPQFGRRKDGRFYVKNKLSTKQKQKFKLGNLALHHSETIESKMKYAILGSIPVDNRPTSNSDAQFDFQHEKEVLTVPINSIVTRQTTPLDSRGVKQYEIIIRRIGVKAIPPPEVTKLGNKWAIVDGNHRAEAIKRLRYKNIRVRIV